jgi:hypothetical protein
MKLLVADHVLAPQQHRSCDSHVIHELAIVIASIDAFKMAYERVCNEQQMNQLQQSHDTCSTCLTRSIHSTTPPHPLVLPSAIHKFGSKKATAIE